jgi:hypothetical protein
VTLAIDGWTNVRHEKVTNILALTGGRAFYLTTIVNALEGNTAAWLYPRIRDCIKSLTNKGISVVVLCADNEAVNGALFKRLSGDFQFYKFPARPTLCNYV